MARKSQPHSKRVSHPPDQNFITGKPMGVSHHPEAHEKAEVDQEHDVKKRTGQYNGRGDAPLLKK